MKLGVGRDRKIVFCVWVGTMG